MDTAGDGTTAGTLKQARHRVATVFVVLMVLPQPRRTQVVRSARAPGEYMASTMKGLVIDSPGQHAPSHCPRIAATRRSARYDPSTSRPACTSAGLGCGNGTVTPSDGPAA